MDNHLTDQINYYLRKVKPTLEQVMELFEEILTRKILKKAVFSKPEDRATVKTVVTPYKRPDGAPALRAERYASDNKALRDNLPYDSAETLAKMANNEFRQVNIFTTAGDIEIRRSKSGGVHISRQAGAGRRDRGAVRSRQGEELYNRPVRTRRLSDRPRARRQKRPHTRQETGEVPPDKPVSRDHPRY